MIIIETRRIHVVNTDPQRRCYHGVNAKEELIWSPWQELEHIKEEDAERRLSFWRELNDYAVSQRGKSALSETRIKKEGA